MLKLVLHIFPLVQISLFVLACIIYITHPFYAFILLIISALFMNFSLHITIHHFVHFKTKYKWFNTVLELFYSILLSLPYNFYRIQHYNHHRYNNLIGDITSTWKQKDGKIMAKNFIFYSFFWYLKSPSKTFFNEAIDHKDISSNQLIKMRIEFLLIMMTYALLIWINPIFALAYGIMFYIGWSFISITNYGQHLPVKYNDTIGYSYNNKIYNLLFFNNGLHFEHHDNPALDYPELKFQSKSIIQLPHLIIGLFKRKIETQE